MGVNTLHPAPREREDPQYLLKLIRRAVQISVVTVKTQEAVREAVAEVLPR